MECDLKFTSVYPLDCNCGTISIAALYVWGTVENGRFITFKLTGMQEF